MNAQFDIAIVGAGILGSFAAYHAMLQGKRVALIEAGKSPRGATVRNFGQAVPSGQALDGWRQLGIRSTSLYREIARAANIPIQEAGSLYVASDSAETQLLEEMFELNQAMDYQSTLLTAEQSREKVALLNRTYVQQGLYYPNEITLDSPVFMDKFIQKLAADPHITYINSSAVTALEEIAQGTQLTLADGSKLYADQTLVCCGHQLTRITGLPVDRTRLKISRLQMLASTPVSAETVKGNLLTGLSIRRYEAFHSCPSYGALTTPPALQEYKEEGIHILFKQAANGELIIGDSHRYYEIDDADSLDFQLDEHTNQLILAEAKRVLALPDLTIARSWNGYYSQDNKHGVYTRSYGSAIHLVTGIGGKGMTTGPALMEKVVEHLIKGKDLDNFSIKI